MGDQRRELKAILPDRNIKYCQNYNQYSVSYFCCLVLVLDQTRSHQPVILAKDDNDCVLKVQTPSFLHRFVFNVLPTNT